MLRKGYIAIGRRSDVDCTRTLKIRSVVFHSPSGMRRVVERREKDDGSVQWHARGVEAMMGSLILFRRPWRFSPHVIDIPRGMTKRIPQVGEGTSGDGTVDGKVKGSLSASMSEFPVVSKLH